jgi:VWFA-related protein
LEVKAEQMTNNKQSIAACILFFSAAMLLIPRSSCAQSGQVPDPATVAAPQDAASKTAPAPPTPQGEAVIRKESKLVLVDAVVTDKKGNYVRDLTQKDFKVFEDNKEQAVSTFSTGVDPAIQANGQKRLLILFFDNSTMGPPEQIQARNAANQFIAANADGDHQMAVVDFGGALRIVQNFTVNAELLKAAVQGIKHSSVNPNASVPDIQPVTVASTGFSSSLSNAEADYGARSMLLAVRSLAKNLRSVPGRKMVILFSGGFALNSENQSELTATIDACNKSNVAIYSLDARGLIGGGPDIGRSPGSLQFFDEEPMSRQNLVGFGDGATRVVLASYSPAAMPDPQAVAAGLAAGATEEQVAPVVREEPEGLEEKAVHLPAGHLEKVVRRAEARGRVQSARLVFTITTRRITSRARSFRNFLLRLP